MGKRGPAPQPPALKLLLGNPGKRPIAPSSGAINPRTEVPTAPDWLCAGAKAEWKRITPLLEELGLISKLDRTALAMYCQTAGRLAELEAAFANMVDKHVAAGMTYTDAVHEASHIVTPSGYAQQSVIVQLLQRHREQVNRYLMHFGLSPAARGRVQASTVQQAAAAEKPSGFARFAIDPE